MTVEPKNGLIKGKRGFWEKYYNSEILYNQYFRELRLKGAFFGGWRGENGDDFGGLGFEECSDVIGVDSGEFAPKLEVFAAFADPLDGVFLPIEGLGEHFGVCLGLA